MEHHGEIPNQNVIAIIPARYASTRLPAKLLLDIAGQPLIVHTLRRAASARSVTRVIVATDDNRIFDVAEQNGFEAILTSPKHRSGSDRIAEVADSLPDGSIVVNVQGDEPTISAETIDRAVEAMAGSNTGALESARVDMATTYEQMSNVNDVINPNIVKVITDVDGFALCFSRSPIPYLRDEAIRHNGLENALTNDASLLSLYKKHTGLYVYRREFLLRFAKMERTTIERLEMLEQLRALENGAKIRVVEACGSSVGVDTADDLELVRKILGTTAMGV